MAALFDDEEENVERQKNKQNAPGLNKKVSEITSTQSISHSNKPNLPPAKNGPNNQKNQSPLLNTNNQSSTIRPMNLGKQNQNTVKPQNSRSS